jgi:hypothetical protein
MKISMNLEAGNGQAVSLFSSIHASIVMVVCDVFFSLICTYLQQVHEI